MYEASYSKHQVHFLGESSDLLLLDAHRGFGTILDLGAGGGRNCVHLRRLFPDATLVALDLSVIRCKVCRDMLGIAAVCGDGMCLPFWDEVFDLVVSTQVIEHVPDDGAFMSEIERVLSPGGTAVVSSVAKMRYGWYFYRNRLGEWVLDPTHVREYRSVDEFLALFRAPLSIMDVYVDRFRFSVAAFACRLLLQSRLIRTADPTLFSATRLGRRLGSLRVAIPRYRRVTVVAAKK